MARQKTWRNLSNLKCLTQTNQKTSHTTCTLNIKMRVICLYTSYNQLKVHVVWLFFFELNNLVWEISLCLFVNFEWKWSSYIHLPSLSQVVCIMLLNPIYSLSPGFRAFFCCYLEIVVEEPSKVVSSSIWVLRSTYSRIFFE